MMNHVSFIIFTDYVYRLVSPSQLFKQCRKEKDCQTSRTLNDGPLFIPSNVQQIAIINKVFIKLLIRPIIVRRFIYRTGGYFWGEF